MRLDDVLKGDLCLGCGLCASIMGADRAHMEVDGSGYLRPQLHPGPSAEQDDLIDRVCPGGRLDHDGPMDTPVWGPVIDLHAAWATDEEMRFRASSGGALSAVLEHMLATGAADYVLQVGAEDQPPWRNRLEESFGRDDVVVRAGSRYAPSAPLADIVQRLDAPGRFVFVGKPCDVAALRMFSRRDPRVDEKVVAMISFMCAGVPSERGLLALLERMGAEPDEVETFRFRGHGWPGRATATLKSGEERTLSYDETWGDVLSKHVQPRCKVCPDGEGVFADLVCADAWYTDEAGSPSFAEREGRSLVATRTPLGAELLAGVVSAGKLELEPMSLAEVEKIQQHQARRTRLTRARVAALAVARRPFPRYRGLRLGRAALAAGLLPNVRSFLGTARRIRSGRL